MAGPDQTVSPDPLKVEATVGQLRTIEHLRDVGTGWSVMANVVEIGSGVTAHVFHLDPEVAGIIQMGGRAAGLRARMEGTRFITVLSP